MIVLNPFIISDLNGNNGSYTNSDDTPGIDDALNEARVIPLGNAGRRRPPSSFGGGGRSFGRVRGCRDPERTPTPPCDPERDLPVARNEPDDVSSVVSEIEVCNPLTFSNLPIYYCLEKVSYYHSFIVILATIYDYIVMVLSFLRLPTNLVDEFVQQLLNVDMPDGDFLFHWFSYAPSKDYYPLLSHSITRDASHKSTVVHSLSEYNSYRNELCCDELVDFLLERNMSCRDASHTEAKFQSDVGLFPRLPEIADDRQLILDSSALRAYQLHKQRVRNRRMAVGNTQQITVLSMSPSN